VMTPPGGVSRFHSRFVTFQAVAGRKSFPLQRAAFPEPCALQARRADACSVGGSRARANPEIAVELDSQLRADLSRRLFGQIGANDSRQSLGRSAQSHAF
jgi:hypothetical protein